MAHITFFLVNKPAHWCFFRIWTFINNWHAALFASIMGRILGRAPQKLIGNMAEELGILLRDRQFELLAALIQHFVCFTQAKVWNIRKYKMVSCLSGHAGSVFSVCLSEDVKILFTGTVDAVSFREIWGKLPSYLFWFCIFSPPNYQRGYCFEICPSVRPYVQIFLRDHP